MTANRIQHLFNALHHLPWQAATAVSAFAPAAAQPRVWSNESAVTFEFDLPGRDPEDIDVTTERNQLSVNVKKPLYGDDATLTFRMRERSDGTETRDFKLPFTLKPELTDVCYSNGVLRVTCQKPDEDQPRKLDVRAS